MNSAVHRRPQPTEAAAPSVDVKRFLGAVMLVCVPQLGSGRPAPAGCARSLTGKMSPFRDVKAEKGRRRHGKPRFMYP